MLRKSLFSILLLVLSTPSNAYVSLTWDWVDPVQNVGSNDVIEMWATLSHAGDSGNELVFGLNSVGYSPGSLISNGSYTINNPYTFQMSSTIWSDLDFNSWSNPLALGDSVTFLFGTLTPKASIAAGTYSASNFELGFSSAIYTDVVSPFTVNVTQVPVPAAGWLFASALLVLLRRRAAR